MAKKTDIKTKAAAPAKSEIKPAAKKKPAAAKAKPAAKVEPTTKVAPAAKAKPAAKSKPKAPAYTPDDVALRAYFISEKRRSLGLHGSEHQDWLEAERQLAAESKQPKKAAKT